MVGVGGVRRGWIAPTATAEGFGEVEVEGAEGRADAIVMWMVRALREIVTVDEDGMIHVRAEGLPQGTRVEVIVMPESSELSNAERVAWLDRLQRASTLSETEARAWAERAGE